MKQNRWYDKNDNIKIILECLRQMSQRARSSFIEDIVQSALEKQPDKDAFIEILNNKITKNKNRWYDRDYALLSAVEMLRFFSQEEVEELFRDTVYSMFYEEKYEDICWQ